ncbi:hypothetical protein QYF36_007856 [Acer negundo]|nr:hypothetical protein QYF36_007856 [Acer negundo]
MALECNVQAENQSRNTQVRSNLYTLNKIREDFEDRLENITRRLEYLTERKDVLGLVKESLSGKPSPRLPTSLIDESEIFGRDFDKEEIMKFLLSGSTANGKEIPFEGGNQQCISDKARHFSYVIDRFHGIEKFEGLHEVKYLRTFLPLSLSYPDGSHYLNKIVVEELLPTLTCLRVLSLADYTIIQLPEDMFDDLTHLRYLDLSSTAIRTLPKSAGFLYNLQEFTNPISRYDDALHRAPDSAYNK